ncbi:MAG: sugar phosphate isomerase/epimerase [Chloroflexi bacterium]|nr:sugar phosphate isomerase/epimerase [Chloroflexota bacterium]
MSPIADCQQVADRIGVSSHFLPSTHGEDVFEAMRMVREAGFKGFELVPTLDQAQLGYPANYPNVGFDLFEMTPPELHRLRKALAEFEWVTIHAPHLDWNLASANRHLRKLTWRYFDRCLDLGASVEAAAVTFHLGNPTWGFIRPEEDVTRHNIAYAEHIIERARAMGVPVGYEAGALKQLVAVCDAVEGFGMHLDIGHAYMAGHTDENYYAYFDQLGDRIVEIHHNGVNHYWGRYMEHQPPHLNNTIDFQGTYTRLREMSYSGPIVCEIQGHDIAQVIRHCLESKEMIVGIWEGTRLLAERWNVPATPEEP